MNEFILYLTLGIATAVVFLLLVWSSFKKKQVETIPEITKVFTIEISPERFLENCSDNELKEVDLLIQSERFQKRIREPKKTTIGFNNKDES